MDIDGVYLQNVRKHISVSKEMDISKEILNKLGNDSVTEISKDVESFYIYEEELTKKFCLHSLIDIKRV